MRLAYKCTLYVHFPNKFSIVYINQENIENRQYVVNMKAIGVEGIENLQSLFLYRDPATFVVLVLSLMQQTHCGKRLL